ncbi:MAG: bifunctional glutamate N-acetyltransferase/amino-acid acetyltransferase ArgJ [Lentisphaerae bacterium]|nr:bifunctional glutamate N-acetyltransferase/amino-acid acetyltransferase ArgJ [Lentisphaerota bacterium]
MNNFAWIENGSVTSTPGFRASGITAGLKKSGNPDMALVYSEAPANFAGVFTSCVFAAAPVQVCRRRVRTSSKASAFIINSGNANACTGAAGLENAEKMCELTAAELGIAGDAVLVASTGRIGVQMPMDIISKGIKLAAGALSAESGNQAAQAIMTTDTVPKACALTVELSGGKVTIGAICKGVGMIDPHMVTAPHATMICCITTDAACDNALLEKLLANNADNSFNRITVDGDMSTNDTCVIFANGKSNITLTEGSDDTAKFQAALLALMQNLARKQVMDGEGATKFVAIEIDGAPSTAAARQLAEAVANSLLCKTAWFGCDPNWGRIVAALGYAGVEFDPARVDIYYDDMIVVRQGGDAGTPEADLAKILKNREFTVKVHMNQGAGEYWVWTSDVSYEYVKINAEYHT